MVLEIVLLVLQRERVVRNEVTERSVPVGVHQMCNYLNSEVDEIINLALPRKEKPDAKTIF
ncbi:hypothetical protein HY605_02100 [Candidatus Peregrinibacteria bacterium]|nr:hypothetical protein [Candidatus Peregrinibacteria bacterium]